MFGDLFLGYHLEYISGVESSVNKQIRLNSILFLHRVQQQLNESVVDSHNIVWPCGRVSYE